MRHVPMYKLIQDHIECFFGSVRAEGGFNNNLTAIEFESAYKRFIVHGKIKHLSSDNCMPLEDMNILTFSDVRPENKLNLCTNLSNCYVYDAPESLKDSVIDNSHELADPTRLSVYAHEMIAYIGGLIVRKIRKIIKCEDCLLALVTDKYIGLFEIRDKGGHIYPSNNVIQIC